MNLLQLIEYASNKSNFDSLEAYISFAGKLLEFSENGMQAEIVCQNEPKYQFWQFGKDGHFNISRPMNSDLMYIASDVESIQENFIKILLQAKDIAVKDTQSRSIICRSIYTIQQSIGIALDALPAGESNKARKINGDLFERLVQLILQRMNIDCTGGVVKVPIAVGRTPLFNMQYQHDLIIKSRGNVCAIGSVKTSSKDRIDKVFIDKFLFNRLTGVKTPHLAIFLNDVQRGKKTPSSYQVSSTFLPGHFKGYTLKLNPLDGVYYCDIRPNMKTDPLLKKHIKTVDHFFCTDLWRMIEKAPPLPADVDPVREF